MGFAMQRLLIRNISKLVSCDESDTVYENVDLYAEDGVIRAIGPKLDRQADEVLEIRSHGLKNSLNVVSAFAVAGAFLRR